MTAALWPRSLRHAGKAAGLAKRLSVEPIAVFEDGDDVAEIAKVLGDVAVDQNDIGRLAPGNQTPAVGHAGHPRRDDGRGLNGFRIAETRLLVEFERAH